MLGPQTHILKLEQRHDIYPSSFIYVYIFVFKIFLNRWLRVKGVVPIYTHTHTQSIHIFEAAFIQQVLFFYEALYAKLS